MDIAKFDTRKTADKGHELCIVDVNGAKTDIVITIRGTDSAAYQAKQREQQRKWRLQLNKNPRRIMQTPEQSEEDALDLIVAATVSWRGIEMGGKELPFSEAAARQLYTDYPAIREQVEQAMSDRTNFLPSTETTS